jgi:carbon monoxide dehydrogenase subunit G
MELTNEFRVGVSVPEAWKVLTDVERIAPMLPGAQLQEIEGDEYRGVVNVKVGPITAQYKGQATFVERDEGEGRVVLKASGRETRGQGNASALITATMTPDGDATKVSVVTDLTVTGKVAQFGRGVLAEVSSKLIGQFVDSLEADLAAAGNPVTSSEVTGNGAGPEPETEAGPAVAGNGATSASGVRRLSSPEAEPVDLLAVGGRPILKRIAPFVVVAIVIVVIGARRRARQAEREATAFDRLKSHLSDVRLPDLRAAVRGTDS